MGWLKKTVGSGLFGIVGSLLGNQQDMASAMRQQYEAQVAAQEAQLNAIKQQNLLDASNASANIANVVTGDTLTTAAAIKKRKQSGNSISSSLGL